MNFKRVSCAFQIRTIFFLDPRVWVTLYRLRLLFSARKGWMPSRDFVLSELLVDPERGSRILWELAQNYKGIPCPPIYGPRGNRYQEAANPNIDHPPGEDGQENDWGPTAHRGDRSGNLRGYPL